LLRATAASADLFFLGELRSWLLSWLVVVDRCSSLVACSYGSLPPARLLNEVGGVCFNSINTKTLVFEYFINL